jgi:ligand-binding sensor domain-containing protein
MDGMIINNYFSSMIKKYNCKALIVIFLFLSFSACMQKPEWQVFNSSNTILQTDLIRQVCFQNDACFYVGTYGKGLYRVCNKRWEKIGQPFEGKYVLCVKEDNQGGVWVGTARKGAYYLKDNNITKFSKNEGLLGNNVWDMLITEDQGMWFCSRYRGVTQIREEQIKTWTTAEGLPDIQVTLAQRDSQGFLWIGTARGGLCGYKDSQFTYLNHTHGLSGNYIRALICDSVPRWVGTWDGGLDYYENRDWVHVKEVQKPVVVLAFDKKGRLWAGTWGYGVFIKEGGSWMRIYTGNSGLPDDYVIDIKFHSEKVYLATSKGLASCHCEESVRLRRAEDEANSLDVK